MRHKRPISYGVLLLNKTGWTHPQKLTKANLGRLWINEPSPIIFQKNDIFEKVLNWISASTVQPHPKIFFSKLGLKWKFWRKKYLPGLGREGATRFGRDKKLSYGNLPTNLIYARLYVIHILFVNAPGLKDYIPYLLVWLCQGLGFGEFSFGNLQRYRSEVLWSRQLKQVSDNVFIAFAQAMHKQLI